MMFKQTLATKIRLSGIGIHSGKDVNLCIKPNPAYDGIHIIRTDKACRFLITPEHIHSSQRATTLKKDGITISTPEHLLAALTGLGIYHALIELDGEEFPILDGSAKPFVTLISESGIMTSEHPESVISIPKPMMLEENNTFMLLLPDNAYRLTYILNYPHPDIGEQIYSFEWSPENFQKEIAPARTFGFKEELESLLAAGLAKGASLENTLAFDKKKVLGPLRFDDEPVRHKILDLIGDFALLGRPINGHIIASKTGHNMTLKAVKMIYSLLQ